MLRKLMLVIKVQHGAKAQPGLKVQQAGHNQQVLGRKVLALGHKALKPGRKVLVVGHKVLKVGVKLLLAITEL